jgi:membrane protease YdiL (CAAX protease family)
MVVVAVGRVNEGSALARRRLPAWIALAAALAGLNYAANFASDTSPDRDILYRWSTVAGATIQYGIMLALAAAVARGIPRLRLGVVRPERWARAAGIAGLGLVTIWVVAAALSPFLDAGDEQGLVPKEWDSSRWAPFVANALVVVVMAPIVEEFLYRGVGVATLCAWRGDAVAIVVTGAAFGLAHGLLVALPVLTVFGIVLGIVRTKTGSIYPGMFLHGTFNGVALLAAVIFGSGS